MKWKIFLPTPVKQFIFLPSTCRHSRYTSQRSHPAHDLAEWPCTSLTSCSHGKQVARGFTRGTFEVRPFTDDMAAEEQQQVSISRLRPAEGRSYIPSTKLTLFPVKKWKARGK